LALLAGKANPQQACRQLTSLGGREPATGQVPTTVLLDLYNMRQRFTMYTPPRDMACIIDAAKVADLIVWCCSAHEPIDEFADECVSVVKAQGTPSVMGLLQGTAEMKPSKANDVKTELFKWVGHNFGVDGNHKVVTSESENEAKQAARFLLSQKVSVLPWRDQHPYMLADGATNAGLEPAESKPEYGEEGETCTLRVQGFMRGSRNLSANHLVHITGVGTFQLRAIETAEDPCSLSKHRAGTMEEESSAGQVLSQPDEKQESLVRENQVDHMAGEQTWPTEEELAEADAAGEDDDGSRRVMVPKGTSAYQAAWLVDDDDEGSESGDDDDEEDMEEEAADEGNAAEEAEEEEEEMEEIVIDAAGNAAAEPSPADAADGDVMDMDDNEYRRQLEEHQARAQEDRAFPDEVDTPQGMAARDRFQRYRGLKSFRNSPWDPKESLPEEYARIFQFGNFQKAQKAALAIQPGAEGVDSGRYVTLVIAGVPRAFAESDLSHAPLLISGLLRHEAKMTVCHLKIQRSLYFDEPIKSRAPLVYHVGFRKMTARAVFSAHQNGVDKHKMERFWQPDAAFIVASLYAPVTYLPAPALVFLPPSAETPQIHSPLVGFGSLLSIDPDRVILKRILLAGHPFRVHQTHAVVRFMFNDPQDIQWFKPVELFTKLGLVGNIKESLGTHGYMKCSFNKRMVQHDTICMPLYKRVFPKWD